MTPRLVLLTGPAAGEVAGVFRKMCRATEKRRDDVRGTVYVPAPTWDEVRGYWEAPDVIAGGGGPAPVEIECGACGECHPCKCSRDTEAAIRSLPGGEAWLVGLVLPEHRFCSFGGGQEYCAYRNAAPLAPRWDCEYCRRKSSLPARLAILAPDPPALLVERVRAWGGEVWECEQTDAPDPCCIETLRGLFCRPTWPEAVRAALGEA